MSEKPRSVFLSHASVDKALARRIARHLEGLGCEVWFDEEILSAGDTFPEPLGRALEAADHLVAVVTVAWLDSTWTLREWRAFDERPAARFALLPGYLSRDRLPEGLRDQVVIESQELDADALDWRLYAALHGEAPGPRARWAVRGRQVRWVSGAPADFSPAELLDLARAAYHGGAEAPILMMNAALFCASVGIPPDCLEGGADQRRRWLEMYAHVADRTETPAPVWARMARLAEAEGQRSLEGLEASNLISRLLEGRSVDEQVALLRLLRWTNLTDVGLTKVITWLDGEADAPAGPAMSLEVLAAALDLLEDRGVDLATCFGTPWAAYDGTVEGWTAYFERLLDAAYAGRTDWSKVSARLEMALGWPVDMGENQLAAVCIALTRRPTLATSISGVCQTALSKLRLRRDAPWTGYLLGLSTLLLPLNPKAVFIDLGGLLRDLAADGHGMQVAHLLGSSAQRDEDLMELLARFLHERDPVSRTYLFEAAMESPANVEDVASATRELAGDDLVARGWALAALAVHCPQEVQRFLAAVESADWLEATAGFLERQTGQARRLWPYCLAREIFFADDVPAGRRWRVLGRLIRLQARQIARDAAAHLGDSDRELVASLRADLPLADFLAIWDRALRALMEFAGPAEPARHMQAELRWIRHHLRRAPDDELRGKVRLLNAQISAWFAAVPDAPRYATTPASLTFRTSLTEQSSFISVRLLLDDEAVVEALAAIGIEGPRERWQAALNTFLAADNAIDATHPLAALERMTGWLVQILDGTVAGSEGVLWRLVRRNHWVGIHGFSMNDETLASAVARVYGPNLAALESNLEDGLVPQLRVLWIVLACYRLHPTIYEDWLIDALEARIADAAATEIIVHAFHALSAHGPADETVRRLTDILRNGPSHQVTEALALALATASPRPEVRLASYELAVRRPDLRPALRGALARPPSCRPSESKGSSAAPL